MIGAKMVKNNRTAKQIFNKVIANPARKKFGFGGKLAIANVDVQQAYTRTDMFKTAYESGPKQIEYINTIMGQPFRIAALEQLPVDLARCDQAWFATGADIVNFWREQQ